MFRKMICLASFVLVLSLVGDVQADIVWTDASGDHNWFTPANWEGGIVPTAVDHVQIGMLPGPTIASEGAVGNCIKLGLENTTSALTIDGGTLVTSGWMPCAWRPNSNATLNLISGSLTIGYNFNLANGNNSVGTLNVSGGFMKIGRQNANILTIGRGSSSTGHVNLDGGVITASDLTMRSGTGSVGTMDITGGTLELRDDKVSKVQGYIDNGWITAYGGSGWLELDYDLTTPSRTTLKATGYRLNMNPPNGSNVAADPVQLQWTLPEPSLPEGVVTCDVYLGTDPNVEANPKVVVRQAVESVSVTLAPNETYYWALDLYDSSISDTDPFYYTPTFTFNTNQPPIVDAGDDVDTWLANGERVVQLNGVVSDEGGGPGPATLLWTVIAEPNELNPAQISDPLELNPTVTVKEPGSYTLQLEASDGEFIVTDTMQIVLYANACEHAKNQEGFELIPGDLNEDCIVNELDLAILEEHWLEENSSTR